MASHQAPHAFVFVFIVYCLLKKWIHVMCCLGMLLGDDDFPHIFQGCLSDKTYLWAADPKAVTSHKKKAAYWSYLLTCWDTSGCRCSAGCEASSESLFAFRLSREPLVVVFCVLLAAIDLGGEAVFIGFPSLVYVICLPIPNYGILGDFRNISIFFQTEGW